MPLGFKQNWVLVINTKKTMALSLEGCLSLVFAIHSDTLKLIPAESLRNSWFNFQSTSEKILICGMIGTMAREHLI